jgi:hypothetical protein
VNKTNHIASGAMPAAPPVKPDKGSPADRTRMQAPGTHFRLPVHAGASLTEQSEGNDLRKRH